MRFRSKTTDAFGWEEVDDFTNCMFAIVIGALTGVVVGLWLVIGGVV